MDQGKHISRQAVFKISYIAVALHFETAEGYFLLDARLTAENLPCDHVDVFESQVI